MNCHLGAKYLTRELAENTARMLLRSSPAVRQAVHCTACGYFHLLIGAAQVDGESSLGTELTAAPKPAVSEIVETEKRVA